MKAGFCVTLIVTVILFSAISPSVIAQSLTSTMLHNGNLACLGSEVLFTCETIGSDAIAWMSDAYIGSGGVQLGFVAVGSSPGDIRRSGSNPNTISTLTREYEHQGMIVLESTLRITVLPNPPNASVTCIHAVSGESRTAYFQVIGEPRTAEDIVAVQIQHTGSNCVVHTLWRSPNEGDTHYEVLANGMQMSNDTVVVNTSNGTRISALFSIRCAAYEISVLTTNVCGQTPATSNFTLMQTPSHSLSELGLLSYRTDPTDGVTTGDTTVENLIARCESLERAIIGVSVVLIIFAIISIVLAAGVIYCCCVGLKKKKSVSPTNGKSPEDDDRKVPKESGVTDQKAVKNSEL